MSAQPLDSLTDDIVMFQSDFDHPSLHSFIKIFTELIQKTMNYEKSLDYLIIFANNIRHIHVVSGRAYIFILFASENVNPNKMNLSANEKV